MCPRKTRKDAKGVKSEFESLYFKFQRRTLPRMNADDADNEEAVLGENNWRSDAIFL